MAYRYVILGAGLQGRAAAFDLALRGEAESIVLADQDPAQVQEAQRWLSEQTGFDALVPRVLDARDEARTREVIRGCDVAISCLPYWMHPLVFPAAAAERVSLIDMGGDTDEARETLARDETARQAGITVVTDAGLAPGLGNLLAGWLIDRCEGASSALVLCGGLPVSPMPPFGYRLVFNVSGLISEYADIAYVLRDGAVEAIPSLTEAQRVEFPEIGELEAFVTSGGSGTAPWTFQGRVENYEYKTLRYLGHYDKMRLFKECGFWSTDPLLLDGQEIVPRSVFESVIEPVLRRGEGGDQVLLLVEVVGRAGNRNFVRLREFADEARGLSAMQRMTAFPTAIAAHEIARGSIAKGCVPFESSLPGDLMMEAIVKRGVSFEVRVEG
ncbi:MAG: hypothetical protein D8M52_09615 [Chlorobi bacterium]|nr:hypothetical protein [Chlorobiota bacterium]NOG68425.1 hypothetical protein [Chlorobiota bacterium]GIK31414.1 MAG: dehydrogenase [Armatimonadota bacterium]